MCFSSFFLFFFLFRSLGISSFTPFVSTAAPRHNLRGEKFVCSGHGWRSASDRNVGDVSRLGVASSGQKRSKLPYIQLLQLKLQQEKSMRAMLERAIGHASSIVSLEHMHSGTQVQTLVALKKRCPVAQIRSERQA